MDVRQRGFHQRFGIRARDQHIRREAQFQPVKFALAEDVGDGFALQAALQQPFEQGLLLRSRHLLFVRYNPGAGYAAKSMAQ